MTTSPQDPIDPAAAPTTRRRLLAAGGAAAALAMTAGLPDPFTARAVVPEGPDPLTLGIASGDGGPISDGLRAQLAENPHIKHVDLQRGHARRTLTQDAWRSGDRVLPCGTRPGARVSTDASVAVQAGRPGMHPA